MYFVRSGDIYPPEAILRNAGRGGGLWPTTASPGDPRFAFYANFNSANVLSSNNYARYNAFSLRYLTPSITPLHIFPMYFVRSGIIYLPYGTLRLADSQGILWSTTTHSTTIPQYIFHFYFTPTDVFSSYTNDRWLGFSLRHPTPASPKSSPYSPTLRIILPIPGDLLC